MDPAPQVGLLGPFALHIGGRPVEVASGRLRAILAVLASPPGVPVSVETLGEYVWGPALPVNLRRTVHTWIARLRSLVGAGAVVRRAGGYVLTLPPECVDVVRFERRLDAAAAGGPAELRQITAAVDLWRGPPYGGVPAEWLAGVEAPRLTERYLSALERAAELAVDPGVIGAMAPRLRAEVERHPLRESLWARYLGVLARSGRSAEALAAYDGIRRRLAEELGADPGAELRQVHADLLDPSAAGPAVTVPAAARPAVPRQLPADVEFVGRADLLARLDEVMGDPAAAGAVVTTLTGPGGAGKTSVAVHWARRRQADFPDGQLFVDLQGFAPTLPVEPAAALATLLVGLGVPPDRIPVDRDARAALYRTMLADRRTLVVLDNARDADQVRPLLPGGSGQTIVTSRNALAGLSARDGARRLAVEQLAPADAEKLLRTRLRRHHVDPVPATLARLASLCGHLPLALVIAAEHVGEHGGAAEALVRTLGDERALLDALDSPDGGDDPAASVRSVFSWSYAALDAQTAGAFRMLAAVLPAADFGPEVAAAATGRPVRDTRRTLDRLGGMHLLARSGGRYRYHDLVRAYAAERCRQEDGGPERRAATVRALEWLLDTLQGAMDVIKPSEYPAPVHPERPAVAPLAFDDPGAARAWCEAEQRSLVLATHRAAELDRPELVWRLSWQAGRFLLMVPHSEDLVGLGELGVAAAARLDQAAQYVAENNLGNAYNRSYRLPEAVGCFRRALAGCRAAGDAWAESAVLMNLGITLCKAGDLEGSRRTLEAGLAAAGRAERPAGPPTLAPNPAACLLNLGNTLNALGRAEEGAARTGEALALARKVGNRIIEGMALGNLAESYEAMGDYARAESHNVQAVALLREIGAGDGLTDALLATVRIMVATGRADRAGSAYEEARALLGDAADPRITELDRALAAARRP